MFQGVSSAASPSSRAVDARKFGCLRFGRQRSVAPWPVAQALQPLQPERGVHLGEQRLVVAFAPEAAVEARQLRNAGAPRPRSVKW